MKLVGIFFIPQIFAAFFQISKKKLNRTGMKQNYFWTLSFIVMWFLYFKTNASIIFMHFENYFYSRNVLPPAITFCLIFVACDAQEHFTYVWGLMMFSTRPSSNLHQTFNEDIGANRAVKGKREIPAHPITLNLIWFVVSVGFLVFCVSTVVGSTASRFKPKTIKLLLSAFLLDVQRKRKKTKKNKTIWSLFRVW